MAVCAYASPCLLMVSLWIIAASHLCITSASSKRTFTVSQTHQTSSHRFNSIQSAINALPDSNKHPVTIRIKAGIYKEKVIIKKSYVTLVGEGSEATRIEWDDNAATKGPGNVSIGTINTATVAVLANNFVAKDLTIANTSPDPRAGANNKQGIALLVQADMAAFYNLSILGFQDTLLDFSGRHYYSRCYIAGSIDFICGNARSLFKECTIASRARDFGVVTAQKRSSARENTGFSFVGCKIVREGDVKAKINLGRAWGSAAFVLFYNTSMDDVVDYNPWILSRTSMDSDDGPYFYEYASTGPGAKRDPQAPRTAPRPLSTTELSKYVGSNFIDADNWLPIQ